MNSIKMMWGGCWSGTQYSIQINNKVYPCGETGMFNLQRHMNEDTAARTEARDWLAAHNIYEEEYDTFKHSWIFDGTL